jgi:hypothetical protein
MLGMLYELGQKAVMSGQSIGSLLKSRDAWLKGTPGDTERAQSRAVLSKLIASRYMIFEDVRDNILASSDAYLRRETPIENLQGGNDELFLRAMLEHRVVSMLPDSRIICELEGRKYLSGGWLEELAWLAAMEAGADEAIFGQSLGWTVKGFSGENEVDLIARKGAALSFVSCKALRSELDIQDRKHRNRLMEAVHEADNLTDHFGRNNESVAVLVTTDLFDEVRNQARYAALQGKAAVLDVRIIALEELGWEQLVKAVRSLWNDASKNDKPQLRVVS